MAALSPPTFTHRQNRDGTIESICHACFVTVRTSFWESELEQAEKSHACDPKLLAHWERMGARKRIDRPQQP